TAGVAGFTGLSLNHAGQGYALQVSSVRLSPATTHTINVLPVPVVVAGVSVQSVRTGKSKPHSVIVVQFNGARDAAAATNSQAYSLTTVAQGKRAKSKAVPVAQTSYDPVAHTVRLSTRNKLVLNPPIQLRVKIALLTAGGSGSPQATGNGPPAADFVA